ncbi:hypothetical protein B0H63DRAFT_459414 [Podospora didyma]|uniref:Uncharacterized protein n=1 Tax=Podospora didyma TaxID=330526 RepID=A0AAE0U7W8_9PEZI|nr:hypothetical protein B0H63DRAFT_459414 [Podospora didyma]
MASTHSLMVPRVCLVSSTKAAIVSTDFLWSSKGSLSLASCSMSCSCCFMSCSSCCFFSSSCFSSFWLRLQ